tara:strand:- start:178 stop:420 length:243 start_codon:yes stop_codon:yes gene_type:complete
MSNILITGCAGFTGSSLCELLLETFKNDIIIGIDNFDSFYCEKTKLNNIKKLKKKLKLKIFHLMSLSLIQYLLISQKPKN